MTTVEFYQLLAGAVAWLSVVNNNFREQAEKKLADLEKMFPSGSGFDNGCAVDMGKSTGDRIVIKADFHHMDENGYYDGWTEHQVIITGSLRWGYSLRVTGRNKNGIKEYIEEIFNNLGR